MTAVEQDQRVARAMREDFTFTAKGDGTFICETRGGCYWVGEAACTCPDWQYRCSKSGGKCKHQVSLGHKLIADGATLCAKGRRMTREEPTTPEQPARDDFDAEFRRIFG